MNATPLPSQKPEPPGKPRSIWLAILLMGSGALALVFLLTFLTLGFFGPMVILGLGIFLIIGLQYLLWGWWFEKVYRSNAASRETDAPTDR
jgi:hypothetical protein